MKIRQIFFVVYVRCEQSERATLYNTNTNTHHVVEIDVGKFGNDCQYRSHQNCGLGLFLNEQQIEILATAVRVAFVVGLKLRTTFGACDEGLAMNATILGCAKEVLMVCKGLRSYNSWWKLDELT